MLAEKFSTPETPESLPSLNERAWHAGLVVAQELGIASVRLSGRIKPPTWICYDGDPASNLSDELPTVAIRVLGSEDPMRTYQATRQEVEVIQEYRKDGALAQDFVAPPKLQDGFVVSVSRYLPYELGSDYGLYGEALASLHNVSSNRPDLLKKLAPFKPLAITRTTYEYLAQAHEGGEDFTAGKHTFDMDLLPAFKERLERGERLVEDMLELSKKRGYALSALQDDATPHNIRLDCEGRPALLDLDGMMAGPREYDLARPLDQWAQHFGRDPGHVANLRARYEAASNRPIDPELLEMGIYVSSKVRYTTSVLTQAIMARIRGEEPDPWTLYEGMQRLVHADEPDFEWTSQEDYLRQVARGEI